MTCKCPWERHRLRAARCRCPAVLAPIRQRATWSCLAARLCLCLRARVGLGLAARLPLVRCAWSAALLLLLRWTAAVCRCLAARACNVAGRCVL